ncbi:hypothetical protein PV04_07826 [Phialophora macrospora]|uniref:Uncharacterized protein n=1 Tax=Phialophora macrospora TaxID=1851006 RepID=A0A0D2FFL6_9EURO|nr:hypothetical protein PV04_07826 [Phialophora macrospora]
MTISSRLPTGHSPWFQSCVHRYHPRPSDLDYATLCFTTSCLGFPTLEACHNPISFSVVTKNERLNIQGRADSEDVSFNARSIWCSGGRVEFGGLSAVLGHTVAVAEVL